MSSSITWLVGRSFVSQFKIGGLGVQDSVLFNKALLGKWLTFCYREGCLMVKCCGA